MSTDVIYQRMIDFDRTTGEWVGSEWKPSGENDGNLVQVTRHGQWPRWDSWNKALAEIWRDRIEPPAPGPADEMFPEGRSVWYEGEDPEGFVAAVQERYGFTLVLKEDPSGHAFFCPPGYVDAIVYESDWPMGT